MASSPLDALLSLPAAERRLGPYLLEEPLGRGGFAPVWRAREVYGDTEVRTVALKVFALEASGRPLTGPTSDRRSGVPSSSASRNERVVLEARALCRVEHPHVVRFYTLHIDESARLLGLVMEYLAGRSLDQRLRDGGPLSARDAIELGLQLASALAAVHAAGLIHRDLKPANVIEARSGYKLIDFGIAATEQAPAPHPHKRVILDDLPFEVAGTKMSMLVGALTVEGTARPAEAESWLPSGTVGYIDPESVATGAPPSPASDLYALGVVLHEALTGRLPAASAEGSGLRGEVLDGRSAPPSLASLSPAAPASLVRLIDALLSPSRSLRPPSAHAVEEALLQARSALDGLAQGSSTLVSPHPPAPSPASWRGGAEKEGPLSTELERGSDAPSAQDGGEGGAGKKRPQPWLMGGALVAAVAVAVLVLALGKGVGRAPCVVGDASACGARCERGEGASCYTLGLMFERASGVPKDETRAAALFTRACERGHGAACYGLGAMREQGKGGPRDEAEARRRYEQACAGGDAQGCNALGVLVAAGIGGAADKARAVELYQKSCQQGYPNGCANLGSHYERGDGVERDEARARQLYEQACADGAASSCGLLALALLAGRGGPADAKRAAALFDSACASGHAFACVGAGVVLEQEASGSSERERAAGYYRRACDEGERQGCMNLGLLHLRGEGVPADEVQAFVLFQRACDRGLGSACRIAGEASATGRGVQRDDARAAAFFRKACSPSLPGEPPDADGCAWLAVYLREGRGIDRDADEAEIARKKACSLGANFGCSPVAPAPSAPSLSLAPLRPPPAAPPRLRCSPGDPMCGI